MTEKTMIWISIAGCGLWADVKAEEKALRLRHDELEAHFLAGPSASWREAARKGAISTQSFRRVHGRARPQQTEVLIAAVLDDFKRLGHE